MNISFNALQYKTIKECLPAGSSDGDLAQYLTRLAFQDRLSNQMLHNASQSERMRDGTPPDYTYRNFTPVKRASQEWDNNALLPELDENGKFIQLTENNRPKRSIRESLRVHLDESDWEIPAEEETVEVSAKKSEPSEV